VYVALDDQNRPKEVPPLIPESDEDRRHMDEGEQRQQARLRAQREKKSP
jgi:acyl-CoA hydrolase